MDPVYKCYAENFFPLDEVMQIFYIKNMIIAFVLNTKNFPWKRDDEGETTDTAEKAKRKFTMLAPVQMHFGPSYRKETRAQLRFFPERHIEKDAVRVLVDMTVVLDIDLTDYQHSVLVKGGETFPVLRTASKLSEDPQTFAKSWLFIQIAMEIIDYVLVNNFGCKDYFWVFSGNKGVHCIITDKKICSCAQKGNVALHNFITCNQAAQAIFYPGQHEALCRNVYNQSLTLQFCYKVIKDHMDKILEDQCMYSTASKEILGIECPKVRRWAWYTQKAEMRAIVFALKVAMVRLDANMLKDKHLFKSPFSVNINTGFVAVPMHPGFDPASAPNIADLARDPDLFRKKMERPLALIRDIAAKKSAGI